MWREFFYYSKSERRAVYVLSLLIVVFAIGSLVLPYYVKDAEEVSITEKEEKESFLVRVYERKQSHTDYAQSQKRKVALAEFDPNTADSIDFLNLGLTPFVAHNILKYRSKGGRFRTPESFSRIYGITKRQFVTLKPYIRIPDFPVRKFEETYDSARVTEVIDNFPKIIKYPEGTLVNVAVVDTAELKKIPGIGSGIAKAIVNYRDKLGGFYTLEQLQEVEYVTPEMMKWFSLEETPIKKMNINKVGIDKLRAHPYLNFYQAKVIVEYRKKRGEIKSLSQLSLYEEFTEKDLQRLAVYFSFD